MKTFGQQILTFRKTCLCLTCELLWKRTTERKTFKTAKPDFDLSLIGHRRPHLRFIFPVLFNFMLFALNQTLRWKILLLYYHWTESIQPDVLKRIFSANFQLSYFLWWTFFAALHNSKLKLILMYLIMAPLSHICFSHSDLFCTSPWSFSASYWWFCMFLWLFCVSLSVCGILHCIKVILLTFWQKKPFRSALQLTWWKMCPRCRATYCPALLTLLSSKMTDNCGEMSANQIQSDNEL